MVEGCPSGGPPCASEGGDEGGDEGGAPGTIDGGMAAGVPLPNSGGGIGPTASDGGASAEPQLRQNFIPAGFGA